MLIKVCSLNDFYSTNIYSPFSVAKHIVNLNIDQKLHDNDLSLVNELALVEIKKGHTRNFYSFATKYCSHHRPDIFPIYDQYVGRLLMKFKRDDKFAIFVKPELKNYSRFNEILMEFRDFYSLEEFCLKDIDKYLWQAGKEYFSKNK